MLSLTRRARRVALILAALCLGIPAAAGAAPATYTHTQTIPVPPASNYAGVGGGDGWAVALTASSVYNVFHHQSTMQVACHRQSDASACWPAKTVQDGSGNNFAVNGQPGLYLDQATSKLYVFGDRSSDHVGGVVCFDTVVAETAGNPFCGFTELTPAGAVTSPGYASISNSLVSGGRLYALNSGNITGQTAGVNQLLCLDLATKAPCAGQPYATGITGAVSVTTSPAPETALIGGKIFWVLNVDGAPKTHCFDTATNAPCAGSWPATSTVGASAVGSPFPLLSSTGAPTGLCLPAGATSPCWNLDGTPIATPADLASSIPNSQPWNGPAVTIGPRIYIPSGSGDVVVCWDFLAGKKCDNFPKATTGSNYMYTVNPDPARPDCIWVNADGGAAQIQNFDAYSGGPCGTGAIRVVSSAFIAPLAQCAPTQYSALRLVDPARSSYTSGTVTIADASGVPLPGASTLPLDANGVVDLTALPIDPKIGLPQFLITLTGAPAQQAAVTVELAWRSDYDAACGTPNTAAVPDPTPTPAPQPTPAATPAPTPAPVADQGAVLAERAAPKLTGKARFGSGSIRVGKNTTLKISVANSGNATSTDGQVCVRVSSALVILHVPKGVTVKGSVVCAKRSAIKAGSSATSASGIIVRGVSSTPKAAATDGANDGVALSGDQLRVLAAQTRGGGVTG